MTAKRLDHDTRRLLLVEAACEIIGELGLHGFRLRDVAQAAGVSQPLVSHHFRTREEIIEAAFDYANELSHRTISERAAEKASAYDKILIWLLGMLDDDPALMISHKMWYELWFNGTRSEAHIEVACAGQNLWLSAIEELIESAQRSGAILAEEPAKDLAMICSATVDGLQPAIRYNFLANDAARELVIKATSAILKPREGESQVTA